MVHLYVGDGKGKTTAAVGLAVRMAGSGGQVLFCQFLKNGRSSEINALEFVPNLQLFLPKQFFGFTFRMDAGTKERARRYYQDYFKELKDQAGVYDMLVLDEAVDACNAGLLEEAGLVDFLRQLGQKKEIVLTGRNPSEELKSQAAYHTVMQKVRHPYDNGILARDGVER